MRKGEKPLSAPFLPSNWKAENLILCNMKSNILCFRIGWKDNKGMYHVNNIYMKDTESAVLYAKRIKAEYLYREDFFYGCNSIKKEDSAKYIKL